MAELALHMKREASQLPGFDVDEARKMVIVIAYYPNFDEEMQKIWAR